MGFLITGVNGSKFMILLLPSHVTHQLKTESGLNSWQFALLQVKKNCSFYSLYGKLSSILLKCTTSIKFILSSMFLKSCCESNCNKGNIKCIISNNNVLPLYRAFHPEGFPTLLTHYWQHYALRSSKQISTPVACSYCTCRACVEG